MHLQCYAAPEVETMASAPALSVYVIGLIIEASIPAWAGLIARTTAGSMWRSSVAERGGQKDEGRNGGLRVNKRSHRECCSCSGLPQDDKCAVNCVCFTHTRTHTQTGLVRLQN